MAIFEPVISTLGYGAGSGVELFEATDIYRWDVDNRPLENLLDNDLAIKDAVDALVAEIEQAYTGKDWPTGTDTTYAALDGRLDNMDLFLQELFEIRNVQYSSFVQTAAFLRERYTSGFMNGPFPDTFVRSNFAMENNEAMPSPFGGFYVPEGANSIADQDQPDLEVHNLVAMETRIEQDGVTRAATKKPIYVHVNGFIVPLINAHGGTRETDQSVDDHRAHGIYGPVTIGFPAAPATGHRFDFSFLEVWLQEISQTGGTFYPYGSRDYSMWSGRQQLGVGDGMEDTFSGQVPHRDIVRTDEVGWGFTVFVRDDLTGIDWDTETPVCEDNGSGALVDTGYLTTLPGMAGSQCNGNINYATGVWSITFTGAYTPAMGKLVVAVYRWNGIPDADDETVRGTISFLPNGNYLQVQHKIRVVPGVDYATYSDWFSDPAVEARAGNALPVATYTFANALNDIHDGSLWRAGDGSSSAKTDLGTFDGYVYGVALCAWSRYNRAPWTLLNQNGGVDRLDGHQYQYPYDGCFLDLRPVIFSERYDMRAAAENTLDRIIRGAHHTKFGQVVTDYEDTNTWVGQGIWGTEVPELWRIYAFSGLPGSLNADINGVRDIGLSTSSDPGDPGYQAPIAHHDGVRQIYSPQEEVQQVPIYIENVDTSDTTTPEILVTYDHLTKTITLTTTDNLDSPNLSGYSAAGDGVIINDTYPRLYWHATRSPVILSTFWVGLGTTTATAVIDDSASTYETNGRIDGFIDLLYPENTGIARPVSKIDAVQYNDGIANYNTFTAGNDDGSPDDAEMVAWKLGLTTPLEPGFQLPTGMCVDPTNTYIYVCDSANRRVTKLLASDLSYVAQWPTLANYPVDEPWAPATDLTYPMDVAVDSAGNVYIADREDHRVVKVNADLDTYIGCFGHIDRTSDNDPTSTDGLNAPEGVAIDSSDNLFIADTGLYRIVKVTSSALTPAGNLGYVDHVGNGYSGGGLNQFIQPMGLDIGAVGADEYVYVADKNRIVQVDCTSLEIANILGSYDSANVRKFFRHMYMTFQALAEHSTSNEKYAINYDRAMLYKFDASWNLLATFGVDGSRGWNDVGWNTNVTKQKHLQFPKDLVLDEDANLVYLAVGSTQAGDFGAVYVFNTDLELQRIYKTPFTAGPPSGLALFPAPDNTARLYVNAGPKIYKIRLPIALNRATGAWTVDTGWPITNATVGFIGADQFRDPVDLEINLAGDELYVSDRSRGEVVRINPTINPPEFVGRCTVGYPWPAPDNIGSALGISLSYDETLLYVCGHGADVVGYETTPHIRAVDVATMTVSERYVDTKQWVPGEYPTEIVYGNDGRIYILLSKSFLVYDGADGSGSAVAGNIEYTGVGPWDISTNYSYNVRELPISISLSLPSPWLNCRAVHVKNDILYATDLFFNSITAIHLDSLLVMGTASDAATVNRGKASTSGPGGIVVIGNRMYISDTFNNRILSCYKSCPIVERGTGRVRFLMAPEAGHTTTFQVRYTPYQGMWADLANVGVYGRHYVLDNNTIYITTLGRGTPTTVSDISGLTYFSNMISHLPTPANIPFKGEEGFVGARITDEYLIAPEVLPIVDGTSNPYVQLPVINRYPASAQEMNPWYAAGSRFDFNRFFFNKGAGPGHAVTIDGTPLEDNELHTPRGFSANGFAPGFETLVTFPLQTLTIPRVLFSTMVVELDGQGYLLVYAGYTATSLNIINWGNTPIVADVFKIFGNPGIKTRY